MIIKDFDFFGFDPIVWVEMYKKDYENNPNWRIERKEISDTQYKTYRYWIHTPKGSLTTVLQCNEYTGWVSEHLIKEKKDIKILAKYLPDPECDVKKVNKIVEETKDSALVRGTVCSFDIFGQPGTWQDA